MNFAQAQKLLDIVLDSLGTRLTAIDSTSAQLRKDLDAQRTQIAALLNECAENANRLLRVKQLADDQAKTIETLQACNTQLTERVNSLTACLASVTKAAKGKSATRPAPN